MEIQLEKTAQLSWLLFSFQGLDCKAFLMEISDLTRVEVLVRYKTDSYG